MEQLERAQEILDDVTDRVLAEVPAGAVRSSTRTRIWATTSTACADGRTRCSPSSIGSGSRDRSRSASTSPTGQPAFTAANDRTLAYAADNPDRIIPFVRLDLAESPIEEARRCLDLGARGIKLHPRAQKFSVGDERLDAVFALAVEREVPILIHGGRGLPPIGDHLAALVERYEGVRLIIAHAGIADLGGLARHFAHVPGVFFDTSVWSIVDLVDLMRQVAPEQVLFATDYPYGRLPNSLLLALRAAKLSHFDEADVRGMLGETAQGIADGAPLPTLTEAKGPEAITHPLPLARIHAYIGMAMPLLWMRMPDVAGGLGLALNAAHEANIDGVPDADLIRRALTAASELWAGIGEIEDRDESERIARPTRQLVHIADILAVTTPAA